VRNDEFRNGAAGIVEVPDAGDGDILQVGTEGAGGAGRAVERRPQLALQIVVLEFGGDQEQRVQRHSEEREPPPTPTEPYRHSRRCYAFGQATTTGAVKM
jgi:hypothetical protein